MLQRYHLLHCVSVIPAQILADTIIALWQALGPDSLLAHYELRSHVSSPHPLLLLCDTVPSRYKGCV